MRQYRAEQGTHKDYGRSTELPPTERQLQILRLYADPERGGSQQKVAEILGVSVSAVHNQLGRLMARLGVNAPGQAIYKLWVTKDNEEKKEPGVRTRPPVHRP